MLGRPRIWTDQEVDRISALIAADLSAAGIAKAMGETRNAIIGIIHRRHLKLNNPPKNGAKGRQPKRERAEMKQSRIPGVPASEKTQPSPAKVPELPGADHPCQPAAMRRVPLIDLRLNECKWPVDHDPTVVGQHLFCGLPTQPERSYCEKHGGRAAAPLRGGGL